MVLYRMNRDDSVGTLWQSHLWTTTKVGWSDPNAYTHTSGP